jgi:hypothetical protein
MANTLLVVLIILGAVAAFVPLSIAWVIIEEVVETIRLHRREMRRRK